MSAVILDLKYEGGHCGSFVTLAFWAARLIGGI